MHDKERDMVEDPNAHPDIETATSLSGAAAAGQSLLGYAAVNGMGDQDEIARLAFEYYQRRQQNGENGDANDDWYRAEAEIRNQRS